MKKKLLLFAALSLTICSAFSQVPNYVPTSGLVGWYPFNGNANDESGNGNNGTVNGATLTTDRFGITSRAYSYDGNDYITLPNIIPVHVGAISFWFSTSNNGLDQILLYSSNIGDNGFGYAGSPGLENHTGISSVSGTAFIFDNGAGANYYDGVPTNNQWYHLVLSYDSNFAYCYINGVLKQIVDVSTEQDNSTPTMTYIGRPGMATRFLRGKFDDLGIWNRTLSQCEVLQLYNSSIPTVSAGTDQSVCSGTPVTLAGSGASSYSWDNGVTDNTPFTPTTSATYIVTGTDASGCTATDNVVVQVTELPTVTESTNNICPGTPVTLSASSPLSNKTPCTSEDLPLSLQNGLVGYWPFCGNANDESGNNLNATNYNATPNTDRFSSANNSYYFVGNSTTYMEVIDPSSNPFDFGTGSFSVSLWFQTPSNLTQTCLVSKRRMVGGTHFEGFMIRLRADGQLNFELEDVLTNADTLLSGGNYIDNNWHNVVCVKNGDDGSFQLYIDGILRSDKIHIPLTSINTSTNLYLGKYENYNSNYFNGKIDDIGIWNNALSAIEVAELYNIGNPTYSWSTGEITESISVSPTSTSTFTCDVTVNGQTCTDDVMINVIPNSSSTISPSVCDTYTAPDGTAYNTSGTYTAVIPNAAGCDSTITINLTVNNSTSSTISPTACDTYTAPDGTVYNTSGVYTAVIPNAAGCDSTITINLTVNNSTSSTISPIACDTYTAPDGTAYNTSGTYTAVVTNTAGCDSTITINLTVNSSSSSTISETVCDTYTAPNGTVYTSSGTYTAVIPNAAGCDSTITINLTVNNSSSSTISETVCDTYTAPDGTAYNTSGTYTAVIPNAAGCDSTITINLTVNNSTSSTISPTACNSYTAPDGAAYNTSGTYTSVIPNAAGCDSTITINLTVNNSTSSTISSTVCDTYTAPDGAAYNASGTYTAVIPNAAGCDSTITINLTVNNSSSSAISETVCDTYTAPDGAAYNTSGTYTAIIPNAAGCDSTITINLTVNNSTSFTISETVCDTYTAPNGTVYTSSGTYTAVIPNATGCDSTITINLTVNNSLNVSAGSDQIVCEGTEVTLTATGASTYVWSNGVANGTPFTPDQGVSTYTVTGTDANGCIGTDQVSVNATAAPILELNASTPTCAGEADANIYAQTTGGSGTLDYSWNTGAGTANLTNVGAGTYTLIVTDDAGCVVSASALVAENPNPCFSIPGGLSPNGDNVNDTWALTGLDKYPQAVIKVFNRWGQIIWTGENQSSAWDGTYEGKEMPTADYYYTIDLGNGEQFNGVVTLKR